MYLLSIDIGRTVVINASSDSMETQKFWFSFQKISKFYFDCIWTSAELLIVSSI